MTMIQNIEHVYDGALVAKTVVTYRSGTQFGEAESVESFLEAQDEAGFDWASVVDREDLERDREAADDRAREAEDKLEDAEDEARVAKDAQTAAEERADEAEEKLAEYMASQGWTEVMETERKRYSADAMALTMLCGMLRSWAGRNKAKADVLRFIDEAKADADRRLGIKRAA